MQYLNKSFSVGPPAKVCGCEGCIWPDRGYEHTCSREPYGVVHFVAVPGISAPLSRKCFTRAEYEQVMAEVGDRLVAGVRYGDAENGEPQS